MAQETINTGSALGDRTGDNGREAFRKVNDNFTQLFLGGFHPQTAAELSAGVTPTSYQYEPGDVRRYGAADGIDCTAAINAALSVNGPVYVPAGTWLCSNLVQTHNFQLIWGEGAASILKKNANGAHFTSSGASVTLHQVTFRGDASSPTFTGNGIVSSGSDFVLSECGSRWCPGKAVKCTGGHVLIIGQSDVYQTTDATASGYDIEIGDASTATLYHQISNVYTSQAAGGIHFINTGSATVIGSQFGKLYIEDGDADVGTNGGNVIGCRILGAITVELSSSVFTSNTISSVAITFGAGTSGHMYVGNVEATGHTITNNGNANSLIIRQTSTGSTINLLYGDDASLATVEVSPSTGAFEFPRNLVLKNTRAVTLEGTSGTDATLDMSGANNVGLRNNVSAAGIILTQVGAGTINMDINSARSGQFDASATATHTRFLVYDVDNGQLERVTVGAADSGGAGFKVLRIPN